MWTSGGIPKETRAPSWSWASFEGGIRFFDAIGFDANRRGKFLRPYSRIVNAACWLKTEDPTGEVYCGHITITGLIRTGVFDTSGEYPILRVENMEFSFINGVGCFDRHALALDDGNFFGDQDVVVLYLLQLAQIETNWDHHEGHATQSSKKLEVSLVLKCTNEDFKVFKRVGILSTGGTLYNGRIKEKTFTIV
jgi:hypothetical protein